MHIHKPMIEEDWKLRGKFNLHVCDKSKKNKKIISQVSPHDLRPELPSLYGIDYKFFKQYMPNDKHEPPPSELSTRQCLE